MTTEDESSPENDLTPVDRPLMLSDLNDVRTVIRRMDTMLVRWYEENKIWRQQSDDMVKRVSRIERRLWLPTAVSAAILVLTVVARLVR